MAAITVGQFNVYQLNDEKNEGLWVLKQGETTQAEGSLDFVLDVMFDRVGTLAKTGLKKAIAQGDTNIKHTVTIR